MIHHHQETWRDLSDKKYILRFWYFTGYKNLKLELEEGLCQVLGLRWLESHTFSSDDATAASSSSNAPPAAASTLKKGDDWSDFEKKLVEFCIHQIKEDDSPVYGLGFKQVHEIWVSNHYILKDTLKDIVNASKNAPVSKFWVSRYVIRIPIIHRNTYTYMHVYRRTAQEYLLFTFVILFISTFHSFSSLFTVIIWNFERSCVLYKCFFSLHWILDLTQFYRLIMELSRESFY